MIAWKERTFRNYKRIFLPVVCLLVTLGSALITLAGHLLGGWAGVLWALVGYALLIDRLLLLGNGWLRRRLAQKLESLGEWHPSIPGRFVGLAHPSLTHSFWRRLTDTDDDVGFLNVSWNGIQYRGDAMSFDIPAHRIESVRLTKTVYAPWSRLEIRIAGGEPFDSIIFDSRQYGSHHACRADTRELYQKLQGLILLHALPEAARADAPLRWQVDVLAE